MSAPPRGSDAMKAVLTDERFSDPVWIYERKLDGIRCVARREPTEMLSRNDLRLDERFPTIADAISRQSGEFAIDGEIVAFERGRTSFAALSHPKASIYYYVFDLLWLNGEDVRPRPLLERKRLLREAIRFGGRIRWTPHRNGAGERFFEEACRRGWEGLIAKRADSPYVATRSRDWLKFKCEHGQEMVIGGYTAPRGSREHFGALLLGYYDGDGKLAYAGKVGTGFDRAVLADLGARMRRLRRDSSPFERGVTPRSATWVEPRLVAQVGFTEWTADGRLRHPRFLGLRDDKPAREVVREG